VSLWRPPHWHFSPARMASPLGCVAPGSFHTVDEWCVGSGCGCETPGVDDDAQMNAVVRLSLLKAAQAAAVLNNVTARSQEWAAVGAGVAPLFNATGGHHSQFNSPTCPGAVCTGCLWLVPTIITTNE
jgi:hypothetical protein